MNYLDFSGLATSAQVITGTGDADVLIGAAGDDTINGQGSSDIILGWAGNDTITVGGNGGNTFITNVDGGSGTDSLTISYLNTLTNMLTLSYNGQTSSTGIHSWVDANGGTVSFKSIENLIVNTSAYQIVYQSSNGSRSDTLDGSGSVAGG